ncbi:MAG: hypothetical protein AAGB04_13285, partial [Pseudomonadota bacterium]
MTLAERQPVLIAPEVCFEGKSSSTNPNLPALSVDLASDSMICGWLTATPGPVSISGALEEVSLRTPSAAAAARLITSEYCAEEPQYDQFEASLSEALRMSGFSDIREPNFVDRFFVGRGFWAFAYGSVLEQLAATSTLDYDKDRTLLDPILSARGLSMLADYQTTVNSTTRPRVQSALNAMEHLLFQSEGRLVASFDSRFLDGRKPATLIERQDEWLRLRWRRLVEVELPTAAQTRNWPVSADHCFARILLDTSCGRPWRESITPPAWRNAPRATLISAVVA